MSEIMERIVFLTRVMNVCAALVIIVVKITIAMVDAV